MQPSMLQPGEFFSGAVIFDAPETVGFNESGWDLEIVRCSHGPFK
jgi:hypothetical protein